MRNKRQVFSTKDLMNVGQQSYFYKVNSLSKQDISFVRDMFLSDENEATSSIYERLLFLFRQVELIDNLESDGCHAGIENLKQHYANNLEEEIQSEFESQGSPCLTQLLSGDTSFFKNDESAAHFLNYLCMQYLRTKKHHDALISGVTGINRERVVKCENLIRIVFSLKLSENLYVNRSNYKLVIAKNISDKPFITCDQPVINFLDRKTEQRKQTEEFGLFYPLSPELALFFVEKDFFGSVTEMSFDKTSVEEFNRITLNASHEQVYASSEIYLKSLLVDMDT